MIDFTRNGIDKIIQNLENYKAQGYKMISNGMIKIW